MNLLQSAGATASSPRGAGTTARLLFAVPGIGRAPASGCWNALCAPAWKLGFATLIIGSLEMCVTGVPSVGEGTGLGAARGIAYPAPKLKENLKTEIIEQGKFLL